MKRKRSKLLEAAYKMPPLYHTIPGEKFDIRKSRVIWWLTKQPDILNWLWNNISQSGMVAYNPETGKWQGVDYEPDEN